MLRAHLHQLPMNVCPFTQTSQTQKVLMTSSLEATSSPILPSTCDRNPIRGEDSRSRFGDRQTSHELDQRPVVSRAASIWILHFEATCNDQYIGQTTILIRFNRRSPRAGSTGQRPNQPNIGQAVMQIDCIDLAESCHSIANHVRSRWIDQRELNRDLQPQEAASAKWQKRDWYDVSRES